jgi:phosphoribosylformylglycinamidine (FGAM) synthase-like amidotransferase family enzyme
MLNCVKSKIRLLHILPCIIIFTVSCRHRNSNKAFYEVKKAEQVINIPVRITTGETDSISSHILHVTFIKNGNLVMKYENQTADTLQPPLDKNIITAWEKIESAQNINKSSVTVMLHNDSSIPFEKIDSVMRTFSDMSMDHFKMVTSKKHLPAHY